MKALALISAVVALLVFTSPAGAVMEHFQPTRHQVQHIRWATVHWRNWKCMPSHAPPFTRPMSAIPDDQLVNVWYRWFARFQHARWGESRC